MCISKLSKAFVSFGITVFALTAVLFVFPQIACASTNSETGSYVQTTESNNIALVGTPSTSFCSSWESVNALNDGHDPANSADKSNTVYGNWNDSNTTQWVQYDFSKNYTISKCDVYWYRDSGSGGEIDVPASCSIQYWNGSTWVNVPNPVGLGVEADKYNTTTFTPVSTNKIRLNMTAKSNSWTGIIEWKVWESAGGTNSDAKYVYGDADGDGNVNAIDLAKMKKYLLGDKEAVTSKDWNITGDLNVDGDINALDFGILKQYVLGKIDKLPVQKEKTNTAPVVEAGADSSCTLPANITLNGTASDDGLPSGSKLTTTWSLQSGPGTAAISNAGALNTTATVTVAGTYIFKLTATDGALSSTDTVTVIVNNSASGPVVEAPPSWINSFYKKCVMINGIPIVSTAAVPDQALKNAYYVLEPYMRKIKAEKPEVIKKMNSNGVYVMIVGLKENNSEHPAWAGYNDTSWPRRGGGGLNTTVLEEDLIVPSDDTWRQNFCGLVHEFTHTMLSFGLGDADNQGADMSYYNKILTAYNNAIKKNLYTESDYDRNNYHEYFCGQAGRWFNSNPTNLNVPNAEKLTDREQLKIYDPEVYSILESLFGDYKLPAPWN